MREWLWWMIFVALLALSVASYAYAAVNPEAEMPVIRPEKPRDAEKTIERCLEATTVHRFMVEPGGGMRQVAKITVWKMC